MINISDAEKALYKGSVHKTITITVPGKNITFTNTDLIKESVSLTERIETERNLSFKGCCASVFSFTVNNLVTDIRGEYIEATIQPDDGTTINLFSGYVETQSNRTFEDYQTEITAYDPLIKVLDRDVTAWYNGLSFPILVRNFRNSFFSLVGLTQESVALVNDNQTLSKTIEDKVITGGDILRWLCQINGRFGQFGRDKKFHYRQLAQAIEGLYPADDLYPSDTLYPRESNASEEVLKSVYSAISYQPFHTDWITKVSIIGKSGVIQGQAGNTSGDDFYISDNKLAWGLGNISQAAQAILNEVQGARYTPADIDAMGLPYLECGDIILANTRRNVITTYILERTFKGIQALTDVFGSDSDQARPPYVPTVQTDVNANALAASNAQSKADSAYTNAGSAQSRADSAYSYAGTADGHANAAQATANNAVTRIATIESNYVKTQDLSAVNARIDNLSTVYATISDLNATNARVSDLSATVANFGNVYAKKATVDAIVSGNAVISAIACQGNVSAASFSIGATTFTKQNANVRLANGGTRYITYLGF